MDPEPGSGAPAGRHRGGRRISSARPRSHLVRAAWLGCAIAAWLLAVPLARADGLTLDELETRDLRLLYLAPFQSYLAPHVARSFENSLAFQERLYGWTPYDKSTVLLADLSDYGNAGALVSPHNGVTVYIAPQSHTLETVLLSERMYSTFNHELTHVANMDQASSRDLAWRHFFGGKPAPTEEHPESILYNYLTVPRYNVPRWYLEGAASFMETWMGGGIGRAQSAYDEMVFRAMVRDDAHFYSNLGLVSKGMAADFQTATNAYLYGTRFDSYLAYVYSPQKLIAWLRRDNGSDAYYSRQFRKVFGKPLDAAWNDWIAWEHGFQEANLQRLRKYPLTPVQRITRTGLGSVAKSYYDARTNSLVGAFQYPGVVAYAGVISLADGKIRKLTDIKGPIKYLVTSTAFDPNARTLFYAADNLAYRDLMAVNVDTGTTRMLIRDARIGDFAFDPTDRSLWGLRHENGYVTLVQIPYPYKEWHQVHTWPYGTEPCEMAVSSDGAMLSLTVVHIDGHADLRLFHTADLKAGKVEAFDTVGFGQAIPEGFVFTRDGRYLYGSAYYTGVSNIFRYEIATRDLQAVSNAETGFFRPIPLDDGRLIVQEYTGDGFVPVYMNPVPVSDLGTIRFLGAEIASKHPVVKSWEVGSPSKVDLDKMITYRGKYRPLHELAYDGGYPIIEGYKDSVALGWHVRFADPAEFNRIDLDASYSPDNSLPAGQRLHFLARYQATHWRLEYRHNGADFYDLFGPTKRSRKGDAYLADYDKVLLYDDPRRLELKTGAAYYTGLDTLPGNQNVPSGFHEILSGKLELDYTNTRKSQGAVDHEKGWQWNVALNGNRAGGDDIPKLRGGLDFGFALPLHNASVWLYNAAGVAGGNQQNSLASFYFGSFGNNYVDDGEVKRYRQYESFPGFGIDALAARRFAKSMLELNLPPLRFEEVGTPGFYLGWIRPALFSGVLRADPGGGLASRSLYDLGAQLDLRFTVLNRLPMTISVGYAAGFEHGRQQDREWMLSLKIL